MRRFPRSTLPAGTTTCNCSMGRSTLYRSVRQTFSRNVHHTPSSRFLLEESLQSRVYLPDLVQCQSPNGVLRALSLWDQIKAMAEIPGRIQQILVTILVIFQVLSNRLADKYRRMALMQIRIPAACLRFKSLRKIHVIPHSSIVLLAHCTEIIECYFPEVDPYSKLCLQVLVPYLRI